jgi:trimeric autotransporter adhesin
MTKMKWCTLALTALLFSAPSMAQNIGINEDGSSPNPNAILDIKSFKKGILIPRVSTTGRLSIPNTKGLLVYDSTVNSFWFNTGSAWQNLSAAAGNGGNSWLVTGNNNADSNSFLGTTNNVQLKIRMNNQPSGLINGNQHNDFWGFRSGVALKPQCHDNVGVGYQCLLENTFGSHNTAMGAFAMIGNRSGIFNVASGYAALASSNGDFNVAIGSHALTANLTGTQNVAVGSGSLGVNNIGTDNVAIGAFAMSFNKRGSFNTTIGNFAGVADSNLNNATAIGFNSTVNASNKVRIGNAEVTVIEGQVPFTTPSDGRFKFAVQEDVKGLDFVLHLRPVTYQFDTKQFNTYIRHGVPDSTVAKQSDFQAASTKATAIRRSGFIAQEVEQAANASGYNFSGISIPKNDADNYGLSYETFVVPLVKAIQEQQKIIVAMQEEIKALKSQLKLTK